MRQLSQLSVSFSLLFNLENGVYDNRKGAAQSNSKRVHVRFSEEFGKLCFIMGVCVEKSTRHDSKLSEIDDFI